MLPIAGCRHRKASQPDSRPLSAQSKPRSAFCKSAPPLLKSPIGGPRECSRTRPPYGNTLVEHTILPCQETAKKCDTFCSDGKEARAVAWQSRTICGWPATALIGEDYAVALNRDAVQIIRAVTPRMAPMSSTTSKNSQHLRPNGVKRKHRCLANHDSVNCFHRLASSRLHYWRSNDEPLLQ